MMARNISGLSYFTSPAPVVGATPKDVLIARGPMRLNHYRAMTDEVYRVPILLVMATTNRGFIFDLVPGQSLVEFLLKAGFDDGGKYSGYIEARNIANKAYIASASIIDRATATSPLFEPGTGRAVYAGFKVRW